MGLGVDTKGKKILLVEDEKALLETYIDILTSENFEVLEAVDGYKALEVLAKNKSEIGLIFLDLMMQGIDGLEVLRRIKSDPDKYGTPPVIILTNMTSETVIKEAFNIGANSYLIKSELEAEDLIKEANGVLGVNVG